MRKGAIMFQKIFAIASLNWIAFGNGFIFGQVACVINALQKREDGIELSDNQISLIATMLASISIFGIGLAAIVADRVGRKWAFTIFCTTSLINWIILYYANEMYQFMLSRTVGGISVGALLTLSIFTPSEYTSPNKRAFFLNMITTVAPSMGTGFGHVMGIVCHWRTVTLIGIFLNALGAILPYFWVESPHWLASKGKFEDCETAFRKLHGDKPRSEKELQLMIKMERSKLKKASETNSKPTLKRLLLSFKRKYFWGLLLLSATMHLYFAAAGKTVFSILAPVMLEEITGTSDILLFTLLIDLFIFLGSCISCFLIGRTSMRTMLFTTGFTANGVLVVLSAFIYYSDGQTYFNWIIIGLLAFYFIIVNAGPYPLLEALYSEIFPLELKFYAFFISAIFLISFLSITIIFLPHTVSAIGYHGLFFVNAAFMTISLGYIWLRLPETKGKTLQEIEVFFKTKNFDVEQILSNEQMMSLI